MKWLAFVCCVLKLWAQTGQSARSDLVLSGSVVNGLTGDPIKGVRIALNALNFGSSQQASTFSTQTGTAGDFQFTGLRSGSYALLPRRAGYRTPKAKNQTRETIIELQSSSKQDVKITLYPAGAIEGTLKDQDGEPLAGVRIAAISMSIQDGSRRWNWPRTALTDDRGYYRISELEPDTYWLCIVGRASVTTTWTGETAQARIKETFQPGYHDRAQDWRSSRSIKLGHGDKATADFRVTLQPSYKVSGTINGVPSGQSPRFEMIRESEPPYTFRAAYNQSYGKFDLYDVPAGSFVLRVTIGNKLMAEASVNVANANVTGTVLDLAPIEPSKIPLKFVELEAEASRNNQSQSARMDDFRRACWHSFHPTNQVLSNDRYDQYGPASPGHYQLEVQCSGLVVTSARMGSTDLMSTPYIDVPAASTTPEPIEIHVRRGGSQLEVKLTDEQQKSTEGILLVASRGLPRFRYQEPSPNQFTALAAGEYTLYLLEVGNKIAYRDPKVREALTGGITVHIEENASKTIEVKEFAK